MNQESETITWVMEGRITDPEKFKMAMGRLVPEIEKEEGTLVHYWMVSEDGEEFSIYQRYANEEAAIFHLKNTLPHATQLKESVVVDRIRVYSPISDHLKEKLSKKNAVIMNHVGGFMRQR